MKLHKLYVVPPKGFGLSEKVRVFTEDGHELQCTSITAEQHGPLGMVRLTLEIDPAVVVMTDEPPSTPRKAGLRGLLTSVEKQIQAETELSRLTEQPKRSTR